MPLAYSPIVDLFGVEVGRDGNTRYINGYNASTMTFYEFTPILGTMLTNIDAAVQAADGASQNVYQYLLRSNLDSVYGEQLNLRTLLSDFLQSSITFEYMHPYSGATMTADGLPDFFGKFATSLTHMLSIPPEIYYLDWQGNCATSTYTLPLPRIVAEGFVGLSARIQHTTAAVSEMSARLHADLVGNNVPWGVEFLRTNSNGELVTVDKSYSDILHLLADVGMYIQQPLAKLQYVWADDDDIRIADKNQPVKDEIEDNFVGDGEAAVKPSDIGDVAGLGGSLTEAFSGAGDITDAFASLTDSSNYSFFSSAVADDLNGVDSPARASDGRESLESFLEQYWFDEQGVAHSKDSSFFDAAAYLEGLR